MKRNTPLGPIQVSLSRTDPSLASNVGPRPPASVTMSPAHDRIAVAQAVLATIFASQRTLKALAPEYNWLGLGKLLDDFGDLLAADYYGLCKASSGLQNYDAWTSDGRTVQIKTNSASVDIEFRGESDLLLVLGINPDGTWRELYYGPYGKAKERSHFSERDQRYTISVAVLAALRDA